MTTITHTNLAAPPKILVLGAAGPTGGHIVSQAVSRGYDPVFIIKISGH
ncbi:hypothetical protein [Rhizobium leguminosarum]|nr:hypothetical protein [Rhizobium leguminosarum]MBY2909867.1 hypothetical protein [Rhizobium leguminosarum]